MKVLKNLPQPQSLIEKHWITDVLLRFQVLIFLPYKMGFQIQNFQLRSQYDMIP